MTPLFKKLNYKDHPVIHCLGAPDSFQKELDAMKSSARISNRAEGPVTFALAFATKQEEVNGAVRSLHPLLEGDAVVWLCYPKGSSKKYRCEFNRDTGWAVAGDHGWEPVRQVAIDEDWSALRFRKVEFISKLTRSKALSREGQKRISR